MGLRIRPPAGTGIFEIYEGITNRHGLYINAPLDVPLRLKKVLQVRGARSVTGCCAAAGVVCGAQTTVYQGMDAPLLPASVQRYRRICRSERLDRPGHLYQDICHPTYASAADRRTGRRIRRPRTFVF